METPGQEVGRIERRLRQLGADLDKLAAKATEAKLDANLDYRRQIDLIREKHAQVRVRLDEFRAAHGQKWDSFRAGVVTAWRDLDDAFKAIRQAPPSTGDVPSR